MDQIKLELADFFRPQLIGRFVEVTAELVDVVCVGVDESGSVKRIRVSVAHLVDTLTPNPYSDTLNRLTYSLRRQPMKAVRLRVSE